MLLGKTLTLVAPPPVPPVIVKGALVAMTLQLALACRRSSYVPLGTLAGIGKAQLPLGNAWPAVLVQLTYIQMPSWFCEGSPGV